MPEAGVSSGAMLAALALAALLAAPPALLGPLPAMLATIPPEPGAQVLTEAPVHQAAVVDLDGDGVREIAALRAGPGGSVVAEAWIEAAGGWVPLGEPIAVVPETPTGDQGSVEWPGTPLRLIVRATAEGERLTVIRQPRYEEPDLEAPCCLLVADLLVERGALQLTPVASPLDSVDAVFVIDLDGDGTDELVTTRSLPPLGDISYPTAATVHRWDGDAFRSATRTELPVGSGDTPFVLGDSDGVPGEELAIIATLGRPELHRVRLADDDALVVDNAGLVAADAVAVPIGGESGVAILGADHVLQVRPWPAGRGLGPAAAALPFGTGTFVGVVDLQDVPRLVVRQLEGADRIHVLSLPELEPPRFGAVTRSPAAATLAAGPAAPFVGPLTGGGEDGETAVIYAGRLLTGSDLGAEVPLGGELIATLAGAEPLGLAGRDRGSLALLHAALSRAAADPAGGRLDPLVVEAGSTLSVAPFSLVREPELDDADLEPPTEGASPFGERDGIVVGVDGFSARIEAPAGSRVYVAGGDPSVIALVRAVPAAGTIEVPLVPPSAATPDVRYRASLTVVTPAGHGYRASWDVRVLAEPPELTASATTPAGSPEVELRGRTVPYASVTVAGQAVAVDEVGRFAASVPLPPWPTDVVVTAVDPAGNEARLSVSGVGWLDYRGLPWIPIVAVLVAVAAAVLFLRAPRPSPTPRRADDDAVLEEMEPD